MKFDAILIEPRRAAMTSAGHWRTNTANDYFEAALAAKADELALSSITVATSARRDFTWAELDRMANRVAVGLTRLGLERDDVVSCQLPNSWQFVATYLGCARIGAVFNPLMPIFREHELLFMLRHGEAKVFIVPKTFRNFDHEAMAEGMRAQLPDLRQIVVEGGSGDNSFERLLADPELDNEPDLQRIVTANRPGPDDVHQLIYTSGTTGEPKGVMHTSNTMYSNLIPFSERLGLTSDDVIAMASPMAHQTGFMYGLLMPVYLQARFILFDSWDKRLKGQMVQDDGITFTMASTPFLMDLTSAVDEHKFDSSSLRIFLCAGTAIPGAVVERARQVMPGTKVVSAWGMTENGAVTVVDPRDEDERSINTDGFPLPGMEVQIRDHDGSVCKPGQEGELYVRGCSNFGGYLKRPQLNATDEDGWFDSGDIARVDDRGYIRICGRSKDIIIRGAENIPVIEVESILFKHPAINRVSIVGYPDERLGERACAFVTLKPGASFDLEEMKRFLQEHRLAVQYWPERLEIRDSLPATASGKVQKFALRNMLREEAGSA
ncbi:cyclohexanecarboxylate-CoA ligase [uncultured Paracoccus sp.]|uniref:cyclohexanecarboxylate-CoA ligase n=1 Tax=uncultured Paracoccus sp. TaxID=189685 RepID=UPI00262C79AC|nr:cyclohexanecarboxylate-CoA ligase [uncultured Paracoccus sp.]